MRRTVDLNTRAAAKPNRRAATGDRCEKLPARSAAAYVRSMERSRRQPSGEKRAARRPVSAPPASRLSIGGPTRNRRKAAPLLERLPRPGAIADGCGRLVRRAAPGLIAAGALALLAGGAWLGKHFVTTSARFAIDSVEVRGARRLDADSVRALVPARTGDNVFAVDTTAVEARLIDDPWIAKARVRRELPRTLVVEVTEEAPSALLELDGLYLIGADGRPFKRALVERGEGAGLPVVTGVGRDVFAADPDGTAALVADALVSAEAWRTAALAPGAAPRPAVGEIHLDSRRGLTLFTREGAVAIRLGEVDRAQLEDRLHTFDAAWASLGTDGQRRARAVHLDNRTRPDHVTVAFARN
jgi:cell division protein FtsQ